MEETIELREIIEIILKGKWLIAIITAVAVLIAAVASYAMIDPVYSSKATVSINNGIFGGKASAETDGYYNEVITPATYTERIKSPQLIEQAIKESGLSNYKVKQVQGNLSVETVQNSNLVTLTYEAGNPAEAKKMLESILHVMKTSLYTVIDNQIKEDVKHLEAQIAVEKSSLEGLLKEYRLQAEALNLPVSLVLDSVIAYNNQYIINMDAETLKDVEDIKEQDLIVLNEITSEIKTTAAVYRDYSNQERQLKAFAEIFTIDNKVITISEPVENDDPVSPRPLLNIAIALVIGLMAGVGVVFFRNYWNESKNRV